MTSVIWRVQDGFTLVSGALMRWLEGWAQLSLSAPLCNHRGFYDLFFFKGGNQASYMMANFLHLDYKIQKVQLPVFYNLI